MDGWINGLMKGGMLALRMEWITDGRLECGMDGMHAAKVTSCHHALQCHVEEMCAGQISLE
jgi:hypothetical protein